MASARDGWNVAALFAALAASACVALWWWRPPSTVPPSTARSAADAPDAATVVPPGIIADGAVLGADGVAVPMADYTAIVSLDPAADDALVELTLVGRLRAISVWSATHSMHPHELATVPGRIAAGVGAEGIAALHPDLVLVGSTSDPARTARLRAAGLTVFACGGEGTAADVASTVLRLGAVVREQQIGAALAASFTAKLASLARGDQRHDTAVYCVDYGGRLYGAATGTAMHDILDAAGLVDLAASRGWKDFPEYHLEDLVAMQPSYLVTNPESARLLRALPGFDQLHATVLLACSDDYLQLTGIDMVEAAQALRACYLQQRTAVQPHAMAATAAVVRSAAP